MAKDEGMERRSRYYQTIAKVFIERRGAPLFLSSKELDLVSQWEKRGIPLRVVLEGIRASFERPEPRFRKRRKPHTLDYCNTFVLRAFDQYRDRCVGQKREEIPGEEERWETRVRREVERFLADFPEDLIALRPIFQDLQGKLSSGKANEEELENAEEAIDRLIEENLSASQIRTITAEISAEYGRIRGVKFDEIFRVKAVKAIREKHKIPHVSPFYY
jgi:hypothetical protein